MLPASTLNMVSDATKKKAEAKKNARAKKLSSGPSSKSLAGSEVGGLPSFYAIIKEQQEVEKFTPSSGRWPSGHPARPAYSSRSVLSMAHPPILAPFPA